MGSPGPCRPPFARVHVASSGRGHLSPWWTPGRLGHRRSIIGQCSPPPPCRSLYPTVRVSKVLVSTVEDGVLEVRALPVALPPSPHVAQMLDVLLPLSISPATLDAVCYRMQAAFPTAEQFWESVYCLRPRLPLGSRLSAFFPLGKSSCQTTWSWLECGMAAPWMPPPLRLGWVSNKRFFMRKSMLVGQGRRVACFCSVLVSPGR